MEISRLFNKEMPSRTYTANARRNTVDTRLASATAMDFDPDDDSIAYVVSFLETFRKFS